MKKQKNTHKKQFDLKTHVRDGKGHIARENHYRLTIKNGVKEFERPPGSGFIYSENDELIRAPKPQSKALEQVENKPEEFNQDVLLAQIEELKAQLAAKEVVVGVGNAIHTPEVIAEFDLAPEQELAAPAALPIKEKKEVIEEAIEVVKAAPPIKNFNKPNFIQKTQ